MWPMVIEALSRAPAAVRDFVLDNAVWLGVGCEAIAWTSSSRFADRKGRGRPRVIVLGPATDIEIALHEAAHIFHDVSSEHTQAIPVVGEFALHDYAAENGLTEMFTSIVSRKERLARACAWAWSRRRDWL
jgi:hypothetical protein